MLEKAVKSRLCRQLDELSDDDLIGIYRSAMQYDGSFDFVDTFDLEDLAAMTDTYEFGRSIIYGNVANVMDPVRYDGYGNLESVSTCTLTDECRDKSQLDELAGWLLRNDIHSDLAFYDGEDILHTIGLWERTYEPEEDVCDAIAAMFQKGCRHVPQGV